MNNRFTVNFKRIIAIDSASFAYVEVPLDKNLLLLGKGNWGKTSIINALRFFLLPELSISNCGQKFAFKTGKDSSGDEYYSKDQVSSYYFPSEHSRLILEVEHQLISGETRTHCQIITSANNYKLNRFFVNTKYEDIEHLFWNKLDGISGIKPDMTPGANLIGALKEINKSAVNIRSAEELQKTLYHADILHPEECPYVIYPLSDISENSIESLRSLIKLLFNQDSKSLRLMTSTAIDAHDGGALALEVDIQQLISEHERLEVERADIIKLKEAEPRFIKLKKDFETERSQQLHEQTYAQLIVDAEEFSKKKSGEHSALMAKILPLEENRNSLYRTIKSSTRTIEIQQHDIDKLKRDLVARQSAVDKGNALLIEYPGNSIDDIRIILNEYIAEQDEILQQYLDVKTRQSRLNSLTKLIEDQDATIQDLLAKQKNMELSFRHQLSENELIVLNTINPVLSSLNPLRDLSAAEKQVIGQFVSLFTVNDEHVTLFNHRFKKQVPEKEIDILTQIINAGNTLDDYKHEFEELSAISVDKKQSDLKRIDEIKRDITRAKSDIDIALKYIISLGRIDEINEEIPEIERQQTEVQISIGEIQEHYNIAINEYNAVEGAKQAAETLCQQINFTMQQINADKHRFPRVSALASKLEPSEDAPMTAMPTEHDIQAIRDRLEASKEARESVFNQLMQFCLSGILEDDYGIMQNNRAPQDIAKSFEALSVLFDMLEQSEEQLQQNTLSHNRYLRNRLDRLDKTNIKIEQVISRINEDLANAVINDLEGVKLKITLNGSFVDLVTGWREFDDLNPENTLPINWYKKLKEFLHSDAVNTADGKIRMENIITQASYVIKKPGGLWDEKGQSTSTQMLINMHFSEIFLHRLCSDTALISFPLIMDEVGQVSFEQFQPLIKTLNDKGHMLIGATTHGKSVELIAAFENYIIMDETTTSRPYHASRSKTCFSAELEGIFKRMD